MKIGDRVKVSTEYSHAVLHGAAGTVVDVGMFTEVRLDDPKLHVYTADGSGIGLFMADEIEMDEVLK